MPRPSQNFNWDQMTFRERAQSIVDMMDLDPDSIEEVYNEWGNREYPDTNKGWITSLQELEEIAYRKMLANCKRLEDYDLRIECDKQKSRS